MRFNGYLRIVMLIVVFTIVIMYKNYTSKIKTEAVILNNTKEQKKDKGLLLEGQQKDKGLLLEGQQKDKELLLEGQHKDEGLLLEGQQKDKGLLLGVAVLNRLHLKGRRDIIRMTWFKVCKKNPKLVRCNFFTDSYEGLKKPDVDKLLEEKRTHKDMLFMPISGKFSRFSYFFDSLRCRKRSNTKIQKLK